MVKKLFYLLTALIFLIAFTITTTPVLAQEEEEKPVEDIEEFSLEELLNVEITTAGKKAERVADIPASVVVITRDDIERYGYTSLVEILENVPGMYHLEDMSYYGASFGMRGFFSLAPRNVIFLVNGVHQMDGWYKTSSIRNFSIPVEAIDRVEVIRGPMSVIYGSGAFFGAINIITNQIEGDKGANIVSASGGSLKTVRFGSRFSGINGDLKFSFTGGYYNTEGPNVPLSRMSSLDLSDFGINSTNNTTEKRLEDQNKYFNLSVDYKGLYTKLSFAASDEENYIIVPSVSEGTLTKFTHLIAVVGYRNKLSDDITVDGSIVYHNNRYWTEFDLFDPNLISVEHVNSNEFEADLTAIFAPSPKFNLTTGLHYQRVYGFVAFDWIPAFPYNVLYGTAPGEGMTVPSLFMQMDFSVFKALRLVAGARLERMDKYSLRAYDLTHEIKEEIASGTYDKNDIQVIPRVAAIFSLNDKNYIKLLYGKAIRHPEFQPNIENLIANQPTILPENINTFEMNYIAIPTPKMTLNLSLFYNKLNNLIVRTIGFDNQGNIFTFYANAGKLQTLGGELSLVLRPSQSFVLDLSGTYQETKDKQEGFENIDVAYSPKILVHAKASYRLKNIVLGLTGRYIDKMLPKWDVAAGGRIGKEVDAHFILDGNLRIDDIFKGFYLNFRVSNLLNEEYLYPTNENNNLWADIGTIGRGVARVFQLTIGKKFQP